MEVEDFIQTDDVEINEDDEPDESLVSRNIILRSYQLQLIEIAKKENTIIYLPTGSGKTLIALHVLCSRSSDIRNKFGEGGKRAFFVASTKLMVLQLAQNIIHHTRFKVGSYTGDMNVDLWDKTKWESQFEENEVLVMTSEILRQLIMLGFISFTQMSLIVFDECHHAVLDHPYRSIMLRYKDVDRSEAPLILGLSAVLLCSNPKKKHVSELIRSLESTFCGKVATPVQLDEVIRYTSTPIEKLVVYRNESDFISKNVIKIYDDVVKYLDCMELFSESNVTIPKEGKRFKNKNKGRKLKIAFEDFLVNLTELGVFGGALSALYHIINFDKYRLLAEDDSVIQAIIYAKTQFYLIRRILMKEIGEESGESIFRNSSSKVKQLIITLSDIRKEYKENQFSLLIFTHRRTTAIVLSFLLKRLSAIAPGFKFIKSEFVVGKKVLSKDVIFVGPKNGDIVKNFSARNLNVLVATNVMEEGVDVSACNFVISFDFPQGYSSYFQSRGRARDQRSTYYVFVNKEDLDDKTEELQYFGAIEKEIRNEVIGNTRDWENDDSVDYIEKLTFEGPEGQIVVDGSFAVKAVQRYCDSLPQDKFSYLFPSAWYEDRNEGKLAFVQLPISSPLRDLIEGEIRKNNKLAKHSAFITTLKRLYEMNEVDECLGPRTFKTRQKDFDYLFPHYKKEVISKDLPQPGTNKRRQTYKMEFAECLSGCLPRPELKAYLHVFEFRVTFERPELDRKIALYDLLRTPTTYAILSSKRLNQICRFPLFLDMGKIDCELLVNYDEVVLSDLELKLVKLCHFAIFKKVTRVLKNEQVFDNSNKGHSFFVVPMKKDWNGRFVMNWDLIKSDFCQNNRSAVVRYNPSHCGVKRNLKERKFAGVSEEKSSNCLIPLGGIDGRLLWAVGEEIESSEPKFVMTETDYQYFVISPNYRQQDVPPCYVVKKFCRDMSPMSPFPKDLYENYFTYYKDKYDIEITNMKQPLLKVAVVLSCSNYNLVRNRVGKRAKDKFKEHEEHLVPELCDVFPFDSKYWVKAMLLPTALNRISHVYCVDEFRRKMVRETGLGLCDLPPGQSWKPLEVDSCLEEPVFEGLTDTFNISSLDSSLPLSQLKNKVSTKKKTLLDPERNLYDIGLCDLEHYVNAIKNVDFDEEYVHYNAREDKFEVLRLLSLQNAPIPPLSVLKESNNALGPQLADLLKVCTSTSAQDIVNYERLEILGDSVLKFATTLFLFRTFSEFNEGILTAVKGKLVGNRNLYYCGANKNLQSVVNVTDFVPLSDWNPPLFCVPERLVDGIIHDNIDPAVTYRFKIPSEEQLSGTLSEATFLQNEEILKNYEKCFQFPTSSLLPYKNVSDKTVADCVEAFLGVYLEAFGLPGAFNLLSWFEILPADTGSYAKLMEEPYEVKLLGPGGENRILNLLSEIFYSDLEDTLGYHFKNKALLLEALTHPSFFQNRITNCYQRLEFLGDAILDFLITSHIYENFGNLNQGNVTDIRSSLVCNVTFACLSVRYELHKYLLSCSSTLSKAIENFANFQTSRNHVIDENVLILLEENDCLLAEAIQVPKALGDVFESLAGAIFLDSNNSLETVWGVYYRMMKQEIDEFTKTIPKNSVRLLYEICGEKPYFESKACGDVMKVACTVYFHEHEVKTHGFGKTKKEGKMSAAKLALKKIMELKK